MHPGPLRALASQQAQWLPAFVSEEGRRLSLHRGQRAGLLFDLQTPAPGARAVTTCFPERNAWSCRPGGQPYLIVAAKTDRGYPRCPGRSLPPRASSDVRAGVGLKAAGTLGPPKASRCRRTTRLAAEHF
ncbi:hypothetical protein ACPA9J_05530 [Pseudomonas aeruginosa]